MKTPIFLVALLAPVALYAAPGAVTVVGNEGSGIFTKQFTPPPSPTTYFGVSPGVEASFVPVAYTGVSPGVVPVAYTGVNPGVEAGFVPAEEGFVPVSYPVISPDLGNNFVQVVDIRGNVVDPNEISVPTPTLYHHSGSSRPYQNQIGGGYHQGGGYYPQGGGYYPQGGGYYPQGGGYYPQGQGIGGLIGSVVGGLVHGSHGHHGGGYPNSGYPGRYPNSGYPGHHGGGSHEHHHGSGGYYPLG